MGHLKNRLRAFDHSPNPKIRYIIEGFGRRLARMGYHSMRGLTVLQQIAVANSHCFGARRSGQSARTAVRADARTVGEDAKKKPSTASLKAFIESSGERLSASLEKAASRSGRRPRSDPEEGRVPIRKKAAFRSGRRRGTDGQIFGSFGTPYR
jgi:hypothetical protein